MPRRSLRIFQAASARLQQTPRGSQEVAGGSLKDPSKLTGQDAPTESDRRASVHIRRSASP